MKKCSLLVLLSVLLIWNSQPVSASSAQAWAVIDADTGRLLDGRQEHTRLPIASLTKIWTAFTYLESEVSNSEIEISPSAASAEGSSIYLKQGTVVSDETLLYGLMLRSGNDAAQALAEHAGGSVEGFTKLMQDQAVAHGLSSTVFMNPSGLPHEDHLSTAYETALMLKYAMENEQFRTIASTKQHRYETEETAYMWRNKHKLLHYEDTAVAGKTGFTKAAGRTLATYFEKDGKSIIVVTLNDPNDWSSHQTAAVKAFSQYSLVTVAKAGTYKLYPGITAQLDEPLKLLLKKGEKASISSIVEIPRGKHRQSKGVWTITMDNEPMMRVQTMITKGNK